MVSVGDPICNALSQGSVPWVADPSQPPLCELSQWLRGGHRRGRRYGTNLVDVVEASPGVWDSFALQIVPQDTEESPAARPASAAPPLPDGARLVVDVQAYVARRLLRRLADLYYPLIGPDLVPLELTATSYKGVAWATVLTFHVDEPEVMIEALSSARPSPLRNAKAHPVPAAPEASGPVAGMRSATPGSHAGGPADAPGPKAEISSSRHEGPAGASVGPRARESFAERFGLTQGDAPGDVVVLHLLIEDVAARAGLALAPRNPPSSPAPTAPGSYRRLGGWRRPEFLETYTRIRESAAARRPDGLREGLRRSGWWRRIWPSFCRGWRRSRFRFRSDAERWLFLLELLIRHSPLTRLVYADLLADDGVGMHEEQAVQRAIQTLFPTRRSARPAPWREIWDSLLARTLIAMLQSPVPSYEAWLATTRELARLRGLPKEPKVAGVEARIARLVGRCAALEGERQQEVRQRLAYLARLVSTAGALPLHLRFLDMLVRLVVSQSCARIVTYYGNRRDDRGWMFPVSNELFQVDTKEPGGICAGALLGMLLGTPYRETPRDTLTGNHAVEKEELGAILRALRNDTDVADSLCLLLTPPSYSGQNLQDAGLRQVAAEELITRFARAGVELPALPGEEGRHSPQEFLQRFVDSLRQAIGTRDVTLELSSEDGL